MRLAWRIYSITLCFLMLGKGRHRKGKGKYGLRCQMIVSECWYVISKPTYTLEALFSGAMSFIVYFSVRCFVFALFYTYRYEPRGQNKI